MRRNRRSSGIREMVQESRLSPKDLVAPLFLLPQNGEVKEIASMPGQYRLGPDLLLEEVKKLHNLGIKGVALFPVVPPELKDKMASHSKDKEGFYPKTITAIKEMIPEITIIGDVAMDPYSSDGHDGLVDGSGRILNDETLEILGQMALVQAQAGVDYVAPSDMMDGRVGYLRKLLDSDGFTDTGIISYSAKYASSYYGPFRDALDSAPAHSDKKTYQMNPCNVREAIREAQLDEEEGADILLVKPGLPYLDVLRAVKESTNLPVAVYNISGEYSMIAAASSKGWIDRNDCMMEALVSFKRAGADIIFTYFAKDAAELL